ncbi:hypothetical protein FQN54_007296 [Arachnomyces sp. PD_36]|nr:hypothetical protein FQN54_007296 [Arachnomyces sp. PD_36]
MATESPLHVNRQDPQGSPADSAAVANGGTPKRKAEQGGGTQTRAKRNRYISIAWYPANDVGTSSWNVSQYAPNCCASSFKDSEIDKHDVLDREFRSMKSHIDTLQDQVNTLFTNLSSLRHEKHSESPAFDPGSTYSRDASRSLSISHVSLPPIQPPMNKPRMPQPRFRGPTSSAFSFDVAKSSLQTMGITQPEDPVQEDFATRDATPIGSPLPRGPPPMPVHPTKDPLWNITRDDAIRLCRVYEEEVGLMYPLLDIEKIISQVNLLFTFLEAATRTGLTKRAMPGPDSVSDDETNILKMILAVALLIEGSGRSDLGNRLFETVRPTMEMRLWRPADMSMLKLVSLIATYHFLTDDDAMAWRIAGLASRMCVEMGLHRRDALTKLFPDEGDRVAATRVFWSIYSLERRWSFGTGLPFVIQDADIDPSLPEPDPGVPYLKAMVAYNRIGSKVWYSGLGSKGSTDIRKDEIGFLDYQVIQWRSQIPELLRYSPNDPPRDDEHVTRGIRRLRVIVYLRANQMRILIYRPVLHSVTSIMENRSHAQTVVDIAKDTIRVLSRLKQTSDIYHTQQVCFNYFLVGALAVLFLAVSHAPVEFNRHVRDEFYMALDLVRGFSTKSYVSKRLWSTIKGLREIGEKLGLLSRAAGPEPEDPHSTAAVAMAGLAGHSMEDLSVYGGGVHGMSELGNSPMNGVQISNELTQLFEAVGGYNNYIPTGPHPEGMNGFVEAEGALHHPHPGEGMPSVLGNEGEVSRIMQDLF